MIAVRKGVVSSAAAVAVQPGWRAVTIRLHSCNIVLIALYLLPGDTTAALEANQRRLEQVAYFVESLAVPWLIVGDWNMTPYQASQTLAVRRMAGVLVTPPTPFTCRAPEGQESRLLDFAYCSTKLLGKLSIAALWNGPFSPHAGLRLSLLVDTLVTEQAD